MEKKLFLGALNTLVETWGSEAPAEAIWAANEFLDYFEKINNCKIGLRINEDSENYEDVVKAIENLEE